MSDRPPQPPSERALCIVEVVMRRVLAEGPPEGMTLEALAEATRRVIERESASGEYPELAGLTDSELILQVLATHTSPPSSVEEIRARLARPGAHLTRELQIRIDGLPSRGFSRGLGAEPLWLRWIKGIGGRSWVGRYEEEVVEELDRRPYEEVVLYATDRESERGPRFIDSGVPAEILSYGECRVTLPLEHRTGHLESPRFGRADPSKHVTVYAIAPFADARVFYQALASRLAAARRHDVMLFVHGVATSFETAVKRTAQIRFDTQFPGVAMAYSWPSMGAILGYVADYDRVDGAAGRLEQVLHELLQATPAETRVHLVGHSLGCYITARAIERLPLAERARIGEVILGAPDISRLDYPQLATALQQRARRVTVYTAPADRALRVSAWLRAWIARVGSNVAYALHPGIDAIDASAIVRRSWFGDRHSYIFEEPLVGELRAVLDGDPQLRARLERRQSAGVDYFVIRP